MLACCVLIVVVVEQESFAFGCSSQLVLRVVLRVFRLPCVFGFCGWVLEALCSSAQMRMQDGPARSSPNRTGQTGQALLFVQRQQKQ